MNKEIIKKLDFKKGDGLIPVVVQDFTSKDLLMLAYVNKAALKKTLETGYAYYWSRSRKKLWMKGESSGHTQKIKKILTDCDYDTILYIVIQKGPACHTKKSTCFHNMVSEN